MLRHISLFSGIGGFDLVAEQVGWTNIAHCEFNPWARQVLRHYWPEAVSIHDVTTSDFTPFRGQCDIITGGFPCQPFSAAGRRLGTDDPRHLWPHMLRAIREIQPRWVVGENVGGILTWSGGMVFEMVCADLEAAGYSVQPFVLPAAGVGAPHRRDRVWFVAYSGSERHQQRRPRKDRQAKAKSTEQPEKRQRLRSDTGRTVQPQSPPHPESQQSDRMQPQQPKPRSTKPRQPRGVHRSADAKPTVAHTDGKRKRRESDRPRKARQSHQARPHNHWADFPTQSPVCGGDDGISNGLDPRALLKEKKARQPYKAYNHWRKETLKAYGNAICPQVFLQIAKAINQIENQQ